MRGRRLLRRVLLPLTPTLSSWRSHAPHGRKDGEREKSVIHHPRNIRAEPYPRESGRPHTACIPLHSKGRRTREASHGEGGLQAAGGVTHRAEPGLRITAVAAMPVAR